MCACAAQSWSFGRCVAPSGVQWRPGGCRSRALSARAGAGCVLQGGGGCCVHFSGEHLTLARSPTTLVRPSQRQDETIPRRQTCSDFRESLLNSHTCRPKLPLRAPPLAPRADGHVMLHALPVLVRKPCSASSKTAGGSQDRVTDVLTSLHSNMVRKSLRTCRSWCSPRQ